VAITILRHGPVADGYDVQVLAGGEAHTLHFASRPDNVTEVVEALVAAREAAQAAKEADISAKLAVLAGASEKAAAQTALAYLEGYISGAIISRALELWPRLSEANRTLVQETAPTFYRLIQLAGAVIQ